MWDTYMNKKILVGVVALIVVGVGFWFMQRSPESQKYSGPAEKIIVANIEEYSTLLWIAESQGYFVENGLDITMKDYPSGKAAADALLAGEADISVSAEFVLVSHSFNKPNLRTLGIVDSVDNMELIARKDSGISEPSNLQGKKIGVTKKSVGEFFLGTFLTFNGLALGDVEVVNLSPKNMAGALSGGEVDAVLTWAPNTFNIKKQLGDNAISWSGQSGQRYNMILVTEDEFLQENKGAIERFVASLLKAEEFVQQNNEAAKNTIAGKYKYETSYINDAWSKHDFSVTLPQKLLIIMEDQAKWRIENDLTDATEAPNYLNYIYTDALEAVKPGAMTIIK